MCGLAGEVRFDGARADVPTVDRMTSTMADRGPDDTGLWSHGRVALGHRRLRLIDLSDASAQPMVDPAAGLTGVLNGCIYNYRELRTELAAAGHRFFSDGDTEVVLKAYAQWGTGFAQRLIGTFAVVIVERDSGQVVLARDRLGVKPLYLAPFPGGLRLASTLPALLAAGDVDTSIDPVALAHYLSFHSVVPAPRTILAGVRKLPPATVRVFSADGSSTDHVYWQPDFSRRPEHAAWSQRDWQQALLEALGTAVRRRTVADVEVGVLLSGGLDSSLVVALLATAGGERLRTFSIGFEGRLGDEFRYSDLVAEAYGTDHQRIRVGEVDLVQPVEACIAAMPEPMISHDCVAFYLLSQVVAAHCPVVQTGQGADEVLGGYHWYPPFAQVGRGAALATYDRVFLDRPSAELAAVISPDLLVRDADPFLRGLDPARAWLSTHFDRPGAQTAADAAMRMDTTVMLVDDPVKRVDSMTMAHGLEARMPFLDHEFVELAAACPVPYKLAGGGKGVLKQAARGLLPRAVIDRPKGYFPVPALVRLQGKLAERVRDTLESPEARRRGLFRREYVSELLRDPNAAVTPLNGNKLWQLASLEMWLQARGISA
ncbi:N-acetylglutaminylglutamine amidotransferase [Kineosporia rhizophila]|uniref:N-acetylglutaminylglutamine amidotransferase n=1 Tax=Kineosporia TaxID=49184 RepID=UPI001E4FAF89|nr:MULTISPECIES: N-acetylglutaminylglutamine amidotransferase [Kineosporia]MCE0535035.1 N-acetylglutaminylglutamine amidotransferase [Kineosporia rhizophila]GLY14681.1 asparagine synthetase B [Kineosporia sp. NBRC 101677]